MSRPGQRGFSLASLFILTTACATLVAGLAPVLHLYRENAIGLGPLLSTMVSGLILGGLLGIAIGLHRYERGWGALIGWGLGAAIGLVTVPLVLLPGKYLPAVAIGMFVGSLLLVAVAVLLRPAKSPAELPSFTESKAKA